MKTPSDSPPPHRRTHAFADRAELMIDLVLDLESQGRHDEAAAVACAACEKDPAAAKRLDDTVRVLSLLKSPASRAGRDLTSEIIERVERHRVYLPRAPRPRPSLRRSMAATCGLMALAVLGVMQYRSPEPTSTAMEEAAAPLRSQALTIAQAGEVATKVMHATSLTSSVFTSSLPASTPYEGRSRRASMPPERLTPWFDTAEARLRPQDRSLATATHAVAPSPTRDHRQQEAMAMTFFANEATSTASDDVPHALPEWTWLIELTRRP